MRRTAIMLGVCAAVAVSFGARARALDLASLLNNAPAPDAFRLIHAGELSALMRDSTVKVRIYDANMPPVREAYGLVPGAYPLSSPDGYDVAAALPGNRSAKLVFYCWNDR